MVMEKFGESDSDIVESKDTIKDELWNVLESGDMDFDYFREYIRWNINEIRWLEIDSNQIDLNNILRPSMKWYKIDNIWAATFFMKLYKSNPSLFGIIKWLGVIAQLNTEILQDILKIYFESEWYDVILRERQLTQLRACAF